MQPANQVEIHVRTAEEERELPGCTHILAAAPDNGKSHKQMLLNFLLDREDIPLSDKIDALEMAGAVVPEPETYVFNYKYIPEKFLQLCNHYWLRALALRLTGTEDGHPIHKTPAKSKSGQLIEWSTLKELLDRIENQDPVQRTIQSLLVQLRISSRFSWNVYSHCFFQPFFNFLNYKALGRYRLHEPECLIISQALDLPWTVLETIFSYQRPH